MSLDRSKVNFILFRKYGIHIQPFWNREKFLDYFDFWFENNFWSKMDFPYTELTPKGQLKVNEGHMEALFGEVRGEDFPEDNIMCDLACLSTIGTDFNFSMAKIFEPKISMQNFRPNFFVKYFWLWIWERILGITWWYFDLGWLSVGPS